MFWDKIVQTVWKFLALLLAAKIWTPSLGNAMAAPVPGALPGREDRVVQFLAKQLVA